MEQIPIEFEDITIIVMALKYTLENLNDAFDGELIMNAVEETLRKTNNLDLESLKYKLQDTTKKHMQSLIKQLILINNDEPLQKNQSNWKKI